jgi:hypothetical protein
MLSRPLPFAQPGFLSENEAKPAMGLLLIFLGGCPPPSLHFPLTDTTLRPALLMVSIQKNQIDIYQLGF